ncbi:MAG: helix-turn-helix transcriptional regulator, partial [Woeseiaceae bacterium]
LVEVIRYAAGPKWLPEKLQFQHKTDSDLSNHPLVRRIDTQFESPQLSIGIPETLLHHSLRSGKAITKFNRRSAREILKAPIMYEDAIKELVRTNLFAGRLKLSALAEVLDSSERSLQRHLAEHGISFAAVLEKVRIESARSMLAHDIRLVDIASSLGYQHSTHFSRAFKRVCGNSPRQYRASL